MLLKLVDSNKLFFQIDFERIIWLNPTKLIKFTKYLIIPIQIKRLISTTIKKRSSLYTEVSSYKLLKLTGEYIRIFSRKLHQPSNKWYLVKTMAIKQ